MIPLNIDLFSVIIPTTEIFVPYEVCISAATVAGTGGFQSCQDCFTREGGMCFVISCSVCVSCADLSLKITQSHWLTHLFLDLHQLISSSWVYVIVVLVLLQLH